MTALRKELHSYIDTLPEQSLPVVKPYLMTLFDDAYWEPVTEPASPEECVRIEARVREYHEDPSSFVPLDD